MPDKVASEPSFSFDRYIVRKVVFEQIVRTPPEKDEKKPAIINTPMNVSLAIGPPNAAANKSQVTFAVVITPDPKWQPYRVEVVVSGVFGYANTDAETFEKFCKGSVPSILFPYIRQIVQSTSADGAYGPVRINPINIQSLVATNWPTAEAPDTPTELSSEPEPPASQ